jgi:hypothetical protein
MLILKTVLKLLTAGTLACVSILGAYGVLSVFGEWLPPDRWNATLMATLVIPIPVGLFIAWGIYRTLDRIWP